MEIIKNINQCSFTNKFIEEKERFFNLIHNTNIQYKKKKNNPIIETTKQKYIENNNMFWFIFIMLHGIDEYN